jgi:ribosomal protein S18 acetylase RimI-like enzyme
MDRDQRHGIVSGPSVGDHSDVERLLATCNQYEELDLPIFLAATAPPGAATTEFRFYDHGALVGFAWLPDDPEPEACLMVHPAHRRRGVGQALVAAVQAECRRRGLPKCLLVCDTAAQSGKAFVAAVGARYRSSEFRLELDPEALDRSRPRQAVELRPTGDSEAATLARIMASSFGSPEESAREQTARMLRDPTRRHYLATLGDELIGLLRIGAYEEYADITAFGVLPAHRGRGYGRQMLMDAVDLLQSEGWQKIVIEVATDNERALGLYRSCGFRVVTEYGFYDLTA